MGPSRRTLRSRPGSSSPQAGRCRLQALSTLFSILTSSTQRYSKAEGNTSTYCTNSPYSFAVDANISPEANEVKSIPREARAFAGSRKRRRHVSYVRMMRCVMALMGDERRRSGQGPKKSKVIYSSLASTQFKWPMPPGVFDLNDLCPQATGIKTQTPPSSEVRDRSHSNSTSISHLRQHVTRRATGNRAASSSWRPCRLAMCRETQALSGGSSRKCRIIYISHTQPHSSDHHYDADGSLV